MGVVSNLLVALSAAAGVLAAPAVEVPVMREADFDFHSNFSSLAAMFRRQNPNYNQDYTTGGQVNFSPSSNGFTLSYNVQQDFVVGRGWQTGDSTPINFQGSFNPTGGVGLFTIYGWTTNPLVEYYIMESQQNYPTQGTQKGTLSSDGGTYQIWQHQQTNQPSIQGTSTFQQYISIRQGGRSSGTVTLKNHFDAWASHGMNMGSMNFQVLAVESWSGSGSASQTISKGGSGSSPPPSSSSASSAPATSPTGSTGGTGGASAQWGQCGGQGWTGPTTCQSPYTCHYSNPYYSQCY